MKSYTIAPSERGGPSPSTSVLVTWFRQRVAITLRCAQARAIHARTARLEASPSSLFTLPSCAIISAGNLMAISGSSQIFCALVVCLVERFMVRFYTRVSSLCILVWFVGISSLASDNFSLYEDGKRDRYLRPAVH